MNINLASILSGSLRFLTIANKAIPLIREVSPTIKRVRDNIKAVNIPANNQRLLNIPQKDNSQNKKIVYRDNSLTFFR